MCTVENDIWSVFEIKNETYTTHRHRAVQRMGIEISQTVKFTGLGRCRLSVRHEVLGLFQ